MSYPYQNNFSTYPKSPIGTTVNQFIPNYVIRSDYLPSNRVIDELNGPSKDWYLNYQEEKRKGRVFTQKPTQFNPSRYRSVRVAENVYVNEPINEEQFSRLVHK